VGTSVVITGTNFAGVTSVSFNGVSATYTVNSETQITATVPTGASSGKVVVTTFDASNASVTDFIVSPVLFVPNISFITPWKSLPGKEITIYGSGFTSVSTVSFNNVDAKYEVISDSQIIALVPFNTSTGKITVTSPLGTGTTERDFIVLEEILAPTGLQAESTNYSIVLSWVDNSTNENGFIIEKFINNEIQFFPIDTVQADSTSFTDISVTENKTQYYRVYAFNGTSRSNFSEVASGKAETITGFEDRLVKGIKIFPNPSNDKFYLQIKYAEKLTLVVSDILGNEILLKNKISFNNNFVELDLSSRSTGVYFLRIVEGKKSVVIKLVKE